MIRILVFFLVFSIIYVIKCCIDLFFAYLRNTRLVRKLWENVALGVALSYIITIIFTGF